MILFWTGVLAISILLYVLLDGFDLGIGILFGLTNDESRRHTMLSAVSPVWDGNETWLVVIGVVLWGAFPGVYATLMSAFYLPLLCMLLGLILRGVAFEFRYKTRAMRFVWDVGFSAGSFVAAFMQGITVGALVQGMKLTEGAYTGGEFGWLSPFSVLCGIGLCLGDALLGASWIVKKCEGKMQDIAWRQIPCLATCVLIFLAIVFTYALNADFRVMGRWTARPYMFVFPAAGAIALVALAFAVTRRLDQWPFNLVALIFMSAFGTLAISFWPYMIPFTITVHDAAAPHSSLAFMFWGEGIFIFPLMLVYTAISYSVFRGKIMPTDGDL
jgi:cytochrome d ubiquinol oxidase subunit II